jgi:tryptophanyl-tRNA synthetase
MRATGKLHLGNYVGALDNWVRMQDQYDCFFFIADWHALTTDYADTSQIKQNSLEVLLDWLAAGLDPGRCTMFIQSHIPQHAELHLLFSMITPLGWLERVPTYKEQRENSTEKDLTPAAKLPGTDGRKMSKSYGNTILLTDPEPLVRQKLKTMVTDPARVRRSDPGNPDVCPVGDLHKIFSDRETIAKVDVGCRSAGIGCIECKSWAADALVNILNPMQERRKKYEDNPRLAWDILEAGSARARKVASATMTEVRQAMGMSLDAELGGNAQAAK